MDEVKSLGEILKEYRKGKGWSQTELADRAGLSRSYIKMIEKGERPESGMPLKPSLTCYVQLARAMEIDTMELLHRTGMTLQEFEESVETVALEKPMTHIEPLENIPVTAENVIEAMKENRLLILPFKLPKPGKPVFVPCPSLNMAAACLVLSAGGGVYTAESEVVGRFTFSIYDIGRTVFTTREEAEKKKKQWGDKKVYYSDDPVPRIIGKGK